MFLDLNVFEFPVDGYVSEEFFGSFVGQTFFVSEVLKTDEIP